MVAVRVDSLNFDGVDRDLVGPLLGRFSRLVGGRHGDRVVYY